MESSRLRLIFLCAITTLFATPGAMAQSIQCTDASGQVINQQGPCENRLSQSGSPVDPSPSKPQSKPSASPSAPRSAANKRPKEEEGFAWALLFKAGCDLVVPGFAGRVADDFELFRNQHLESIKRAEADTQLRAQIEEMTKIFQSATRPAITPAQIEFCENIAKGLTEYREPADPRLQSPELALQGWQAAMRSGDREGAARFLTGRELKRLGPDLADMSLDQMRKMADSADRIQIVQKNYHHAEESATPSSRLPATFFKVGQNWKIEYL